MRTEREKELIDLLARVAPGGVRVHFRPIDPLLRELSAGRDELLELVAKPITAGDFEVSLDRGDCVRFERIARPSTAARAPSIAVAPPAPHFQAGPASEFDPAAIGKQAQAYQATERNAGREVSATEAVRHVLETARHQAATQAARAKAQPRVSERPAAWNPITGEPITFARNTNEGGNHGK